MSEDKKFTRKLRNGGSSMSEEDVALMVAEDKRLVAMGIDPDGDPGKIARQVDAIYKAVRAKPENQ